MSSPTNTAAVGTQPKQPPGTAHPQMGSAPGPTGDRAPQPQTPPGASTRGRQPAACQAAATQANPEPRPRHGTPNRRTEGPSHAPPEGPPTHTRTATPTDVTNTRPFRTVRPNTNNATKSPSPQAPATPSASTPGDHPQAPAQAEPASQRHNDPPARPAVRPTETSSRSRPAPDPGPNPDQDPAQATVPADDPRSADPGSQPGPTPMSEGHNRETARPRGNAAMPSAPPAQPQREEPTVSAREKMGGPPQRTEAPPPATDLPQTVKSSGEADQPENQRAGPPGMAANGSGESSTAGQPGTEPEDTVPDAEHDASLPPPSAHGAQPAGRADAGPLATAAHHADASAQGEAPPRGPPETRAKSGARKTTPDTPQHAGDRETLPSGHNRDKDSFDAFMESCMSDPHADRSPAALRVRLEPRRDYSEGTPLTVWRQAPLQRDYTVLQKTEHATAADDGTATASGAADQAPDEHGAPGSGTPVEACINTASEPTGQPPGTVPPWGRGHLDYARLEGDARHPSDHAEEAAAQNLGLWIDRLTTEEQLALAVCIQWLLNSQSRRLVEGARTMADTTFGHRTGHTPLATMDHPGQWHYVATRLMAHMGAYSPDKMNGLHWQWHQRAALRICTAMQRHNVWDIPGSPGYQGHASGHRRPRSQEVREPARQAACRNSPERRQGPPPGVGSPSSTYRTPPPRTFAPRGGQGSPHTSGVQGGRPELHQETRNPGPSRRRSRTPPPAARQVVFHEDTDRGHGGPSDLHAQRTSSTTDPRRRSKRPRTERAHIPAIATLAERERQAALHTDPHWAADGASSSYATSLRGLASGPLPGGQHATDTGPREPSADQGPEQEVGGQPPQHPPLRAGRDDTGPRHGHGPPDQLGPYTTGFPTPAATRPNPQGAEDAPQQPEHDVSDPGQDAEMTQTSGPQESGDSLPDAAACSMPQQWEPSTGNVPGGQPGTAPGHPLPDWRHTGPGPGDHAPPTPQTTATEEHGSL